MQHDHLLSRCQKISWKLRATSGKLERETKTLVLSIRREKEAYKPMATHNHEGKIWSNVTLGANRRQGPGTSFAVIDTLPANQQLIVLCYRLGDSESFTAPNGQSFTSDAWDFVVTSDQDHGGYVADVLIDTGGDIRQQLGSQGPCDALIQRLSFP
jgi:hypothetical protein